MHDAEAALDLRLGWEAFPSLAGDLEKTDWLDRTLGLPYDLRDLVVSGETSRRARRWKATPKANA